MDSRKPNEDEVRTFEASLPDDPRVQRTKMFGLPHGKVGEYMFAGRHASGVTVRLAPDERDALLKKGAKFFEPMPGRPMKDWLLVPEAIAKDARALAQLVRRAFEYTATLPPKGAKAPRSAAAKKKPAASAASRKRR
jgi:hypothetical protein